MPPHLECSVCRERHALEANLESHFLLDEAIVRGMRERGLRSLVWALGFLQASAEHAFLYAPPLDLFVDGTRRTDIDLPCIIDGRLVIGEAKDSRREVKRAASDSLIAAARIVRPDAIVLACPDPQAVDAVRKQIEYIKATLADPRIDAKALTAENTQAGIPTSILARHYWRHEHVQIVRLQPTPPAPPPTPPPA